MEEYTRKLPKAREPRLKNKNSQNPILKLIHDRYNLKFLIQDELLLVCKTIFFFFTFELQC